MTFATSSGGKPKTDLPANKTRTATAPKALSLHLGLNAVSAAAYEGWTGPLAACEFDANDMAALARGRDARRPALPGKHRLADLSVPRLGRARGHRQQPKAGRTSRAGRPMTTPRCGL
jgi:hypothetical protein